MGRLVVRFFSTVDFFIAGVSVTHPVHLTRLKIPNIVWCGVNSYFYFLQRFSPFLEDPDKRRSSPLGKSLFVLSTMTRRLAARAGGRNSGCCSSSTYSCTTIVQGGVELARLERQFWTSAGDRCIHSEGGKEPRGPE